MAAYESIGDGARQPFVSNFGFMLDELPKSEEMSYGGDRDRRKPRAENRSRSPFLDDDRRSPKRRDNRDSRRDDRSGFFRENEDRRRKRSNERKDRYSERQDSWEAQFNQGPSYAPQPPTMASFTDDPMGLFPGQQNYDQYSGNMYQGYPAAMPPPAPSLMEVPQAPLPPQWGGAMQMPLRQDNTQVDQIKKEAIASEVRQQKATLARQREEYLRKADGLKKELDTLRDQRSELRGSNSRRSPSPDSRRFLKENAKLQLEIQNKLKTMNNVIDMLSGIIGEVPRAMSADKSTDRKDRKAGGMSSNSSPSSSPDRDKKKKKSRSRSRSLTTDKKFNYVYYDPEMHWCRICNEFPPTAKDYLNHLHTQQHQKNAAVHMEAPWHSAPNLNEGLPNYPSAPNKRTPIRGLQFFIPSTAWYCKMCDQWIGDLHCASAHLKSLTHSKNYTTFVDQNPHWEIDWMSDRQKAFEKARAETEKAESEKIDSQPYAAHTITFDKDGFRTKRKPSPTEEDSSKEKKDKKDKKKKKEKKHKKHKKRSSSSSSQSSKSSEDEKPPLKKSVKQQPAKDRQDGWQRVASPPPPVISGGEDRMLSQWMSLQEDRLSDNDKRVLQNLKNRVKNRIAEETSATKKPHVDNHKMLERKNQMQLQERERGSKDSKDHGNRDHHNRNRHSGNYRDNRHHQERDHERDEKPRSTPQSKHYQEREKDKGKNNETKKMPFIGKMPVFKTLIKPQKPEESKPEPSPAEELDAKKRRDEIAAQIQKTVQEFKDKLKQQQVFSGHLAAPGLAMPTALGGVVVTPIVPASVVASLPQTIHRIQKQTPVTTSAPPTVPQMPKVKGSKKDDPLHSDFQEALDIIFPSENKKPDGNMMMPHNIPGYGMMQGSMPFMPNGSMGMMGPMPNYGFDYTGMYPGGMYDMSMMPKFGPQLPHKSENGADQVMVKEESKPSPPSAALASLEEKKKAKMQELEDLAMLGIQAEDVGASGF